MLSSELSVAAIENNVDAFDGLIKKGCDPNYNDTNMLSLTYPDAPSYAEVQSSKEGIFVCSILSPKLFTHPSRSCLQEASTSQNYFNKTLSDMTGKMTTLFNWIVVIYHL